jgi:beta-glucosidase
VLEYAGARGIRVIVSLFSGRPLIVPWLAEKADALLAVWFLGSEAGNAISDVVTGKVSPSGRTPITWPRALGQVPVYFGQRPSGRPFNREDHFTSKYIDVPNEPLYAFGHGLSYGRFSYANLRVTPASVAESDTIRVRLDVTNEGSRAAQDTIFLFTRDPVATVTRPLLELKGFAKIDLEPGRTGQVEIALPAVELRFLGRNLTPVFEPGAVQVLVGPCADRSKLLVESVHLRGL